MSYAITIRTANESGQAVIRLWDEASEFEAAPSMQRLGYAPHITLAVYETVDPDRLVEGMNAIFADAPSLVVRFDRIRVFDGEMPVLWAAPNASAMLEQWARTLHDLIDPDLCHPHYRPGAWRPHCTLATDIRPEYAQAARDFARRRLSPFDVTFDFADCVKFPPVRTLGSLPLSGGC